MSGLSTPFSRTFFIWRCQGICCEDRLGPKFLTKGRSRGPKFLKKGARILFLWKGEFFLQKGEFLQKVEFLQKGEFLKKGQDLYLKNGEFCRMVMVF